MKLSKEQVRALANKICQEVNLANTNKKNEFLADKSNRDFIKIQKTEWYKCIVKAIELGAIYSVTLTAKILSGQSTDYSCGSGSSFTTIESFDRLILNKLYSVKFPKQTNLYSDIVYNDIYLATIEEDNIDSLIESIKNKYLN